MSEQPPPYSPFAQMGGVSAWRGLVQTDNQNLSGRTAVSRGQVGTVVYRYDLSRANFRVSGVTRTSAGISLAGCRVELFLTGSDTPQQTVISDASGNYNFWSPGTGPFYIVAYKAGAPDVAGTSVNTLLPITF